MKRRIAIATMSTTAFLIMVPGVTGIAGATHQSGWENGGASAPATTTFEDVAASATGGVVVAVGIDAGTTTGPADDSAAVYRRAGESWRTDIVPLPSDATPNSLADVAVSADGTAAWLVGTYTPASQTDPKPLVARLGSDGLESGTSATWDLLGDEAGTADDLPAELSEPLSVALDGAHGLIGDDDGDIFHLDDTTSPATFARVGSSLGVAVNGLTTYSISQSQRDSGVLVAGFAVTAYDFGKALPRIYRVRVDSTGSLTPISPVDENALSGGQGMEAVSATTAGHAFALERESSSGGIDKIWSPSPTTGTWTRRQAASFSTSLSKPRAASSAAPSGSPTIQAISGRHDGGAVWRGVGSADWVRDDIKHLSPGSLNGVAAIDHTEIWAAGAGGAIVHYTPQADPRPQPVSTPPPVPDTSITGGPVGSSTNPDVTFSFVSNQAGVSFECQLDGSAYAPCSSPKPYSNLPEGTHTFAVRAVGPGGTDPTPATRQFGIVRPEQTEERSKPDTVVKDEGGKKCKRRQPKQLAKNVKVRVKRKKIVVRFKLKRKAKVKAIAKRKGKKVGKEPKQVLKRGKHKLKFKVKKSPTKVKLVVKPAKRC